MLQSYQILPVCLGDYHPVAYNNMNDISTRDTRATSFGIIFMMTDTISPRFLLAGGRFAQLKLTRLRVPLGLFVKSRVEFSDKSMSLV